MALMPIATLLLAHWLLEHEPPDVATLSRGGHGVLLGSGC